MKSKIVVYSLLVVFFCLSLAYGEGIRETPSKHSLKLGPNDDVEFNSVTATAGTTELNHVYVTDLTATTSISAPSFVAEKVVAEIPAGNINGTYAGIFKNLSNENGSQHCIYGSVANGGGDLIKLVASGTTRFKIENNGIVTLLIPQTYADNAAALSAGLSAGMLYRTSTGVLMIVY
ncbi:MAG: hypothetical protein PHW65_04575 [Dehalococcoidales bacterium]|nr:hypothetical protein [Dehalococcoidales bacterium]